MKDPSYAIRDAYYLLLNGNLTHKGNPVPVYDASAARYAIAPYVILGEQTMVQRENKCDFNSECSIILIVVTAFPAGDPGNKKYADDIANQVTSIIMQAPKTNNIDLSPDFICQNTRLDGSNSSTSQDETYKYVEKAIRFTHIIKEL
ncbi:hypothetical protein [Chitinophaga sp.]|uniref:hypothetical protein n=1 Tax=Chitinophaga sp. TaxID=1869181 RepID=UPI0031E4204C